MAVVQAQEQAARSGLDHKAAPEHAERNPAPRSLSDQYQEHETAAAGAPSFSYEAAFDRNLGWVTAWEQQELRGKKVAIAGMGGVGGAHLLTLARLGIGAFHIADFDRFDFANFNRQVGANVETVGRPKVEVMAEMAREINPDLEIATFPAGIDASNLDRFLDGVDLYIDGLDFFVLDVRAKVFAECAKRGIPAITAAPIGMGTAYLIFMPGGMSFEEYFRLEGQPQTRQYVNFLTGLVPKGYHRAYLMDPWRIDLAGKRGPSTAMACQLCAGVTGVEALKILLGRGPVRAAPYYHHFDAFRGKWSIGRLPGGNRHPLQAIKRYLGYYFYGRLSREARQAEAELAGSEVEQILELARWAPSGDNQQPWRFQILDSAPENGQEADPGASQGVDRVMVRIPAATGTNPYEYNDGQPTLLSAGMLLETMRIAASGFQRSFEWVYHGSTANGHLIEARFTPKPQLPRDPLFPYIKIRSVDRRPYKSTRLTRQAKQALDACLGDYSRIHWHETRAERWRIASIGALATDIRLRMPEAYDVHRSMLDWTRPLSPDGIPAGAVGLDSLTLRLMRWAMRDWSRVDFLNRYLGGTGMPRFQMDLAPGLQCAAHFTITWKSPPRPDDRIPALLRLGQDLQRFWLTATQLGLVMQPNLAPLCLAHYARNGIPFTRDPSVRRKADALAFRMNALLEERDEDLVFLGRLGWPKSRRVPTRSVRRPLAELLES
ncbi:ThiF family adenylyltransferase [Rhodospirillaceae bacterium SYSU D60014]|uniref:ThiF family adenylyltransferase n=1 Tax=Virgifigura deserti TaxID=2268457 RepID=UPI000E674745